MLAGKLLQRQNASLCRGAATEIPDEACARLVRLDSGFIESVENLKLAIDLRNRIIHGYDAVDDEIVYLTVVGDLPALRIALAKLLAERG